MTHNLPKIKRTKKNISTKDAEKIISDFSKSAQNLSDHDHNHDHSHDDKKEKKINKSSLETKKKTKKVSKK